MPLDPQARALIDQIALLEVPPLETLTPEQARRNTAESSASLPRPGGLGRVEDLAAAGPGGPIPLRLYTPRAPEPRPGLVWFHGGGWVTGDLESHDGLCRQLALDTGASVVAVDYRLAPEHRFPAAVEDAVAATRWVADCGERLGIDTDRLAVGGDSAGGNLAAVVASIARERGPALRWQLLVYPITDCDLDTPSYRENATGYLLSRAGMEWFWSHYVPDQASRSHPHASPLRASDLGGLPPAYVITAEYDAGVPTRLDRFEGMVHGFLRRTDRLDRSRDAIQRIAAELARQLEPPS